MSLFDVNYGQNGISITPSKAAIAATEEAIERVETNADPDWKAEALNAVRRIARRRASFTAEHVWTELVAQGVTTHEPRAMGAIIRKAAKQNICEATEHWQKTNSRQSHRRPQQVWRSLIFENPL